MPTVHDLIVELRRLANQLAGDTAGLGIMQDAVDRCDDGESPPAVDAAMQDLLAGCERLQVAARTLKRARNASVARQLERLAPPSTGLRLNLTGTRVPGWLSVGFPPAELVLDLRWGLPFADAAADRVYSALALEHLVYPDDARRVVRDVRRVLRPGGVARVIVPDLEVYLRAYVRGDRAFFRAHERWFAWARHTRTPLDVINAMVGAGLARGPADHDGHRTGYDLATLTTLLRDAGFSSIERRGYQDSPYPELRIDHTSADAGLTYEGESLNLFVEAS